MRHAPKPRRSQDGFTITELLAVVIIVGVLATLATYSVRNYIASARTSEALSMIPLIKAAQEAYRSETFVYCDVSSSYDDTFPMAKGDIGKGKWDWGGTSALAKKWSELGVETSSPVQFGYVTKAAAPGAGLTEPSSILPSGKTFGFPSASADPSYIVMAYGNVDNDDKFSYVVSHSFSAEVYLENEGE